MSQSWTPGTSASWYRRRATSASLSQGRPSSARFSAIARYSPPSPTVRSQDPATSATRYATKQRASQRRVSGFGGSEAASIIDLRREYNLAELASMTILWWHWLVLGLLLVLAELA